MTAGDKESDELEKLLADVQRTIRENDRFIRNLKDEAVDDGEAGPEEDSGQDIGGEGEGYEEL